MPRYRLNYCEVLEFEGQTAGEVVPFIAVSHMMGGESELKFVRRLAIEMCEYNGKNYCYSNRHRLARRSGLRDRLSGIGISLMLF